MSPKTDYFCCTRISVDLHLRLRRRLFCELASFRCYFDVYIHSIPSQLSMKKTIADKIKFKNGWPVNSPNLTVSRFFFFFSFDGPVDENPSTPL